MYDILYMHFSARKLCVTHDTSYLMWAKQRTVLHCAHRLHLHRIFIGNRGCEAAGSVFGASWRLCLRPYLRSQLVIVACCI